MIGIILFFFIIMAGGLFGAVRLKTRLEETLPTWMMFIIVLLFLFGLIGNLLWGIYAVILLACLCYAGAIWVLVKRRDIVQLKYIVKNNRGAFLLFLFFFCVAVYANRGMTAHIWDEFSHWMSVVKSMVYLDDFGTNPAAHAGYASYPPGISLFQYLGIRLVLLFDKSTVYPEWIAYLAFQVFFTSLFFPLLKLCRGETVFKKALWLLCAFVMPLFFFPQLYQSTYVDPMLGLLTGTGFSVVLLTEDDEKEVFYNLYIMLECTMLILFKDAGMLFALFLGAAYVEDYLRRTNRKEACRRLVFVVMSIVIPKLLWMLEIRNVPRNFAAPNIIDLMRMVATGSLGYRKEVLKNYVEAMFDKTIAIGNTNLFVSYAVLAIIMLLASYLIVKTTCKRELWMGCALLLSFIIGMCITYMLNFSEFEAINLYSFERYLNMAYLSLAIPITYSFYHRIVKGYKTEDTNKPDKALVILLLLVIMMSPIKEIFVFLGRGYIAQAMTAKTPYIEICKKIELETEPESKIVVVSQGDNQRDKLCIEYGVRPERWVYRGYSFGDETVAADSQDSMYRDEMSAKDWMKQLKSDKIDYIVLYRIDSYFLDTFKSCFETEAELIEGEIYRIRE